MHLILSTLAHVKAGKVTHFCPIRYVKYTPCIWRSVHNIWQDHLPR